LLVLTTIDTVLLLVLTIVTVLEIRPALGRYIDTIVTILESIVNNTRDRVITTVSIVVDTTTVSIVINIASLATNACLLYL